MTPLEQHGSVVLVFELIARNGRLQYIFRTH